MKLPISDPMERIVAAAFDAAGIAYVHEDQTTNGLDFRLPSENVFVEVKQLHSPRIAAQMAREANVIAIQGRRAVEWFAQVFIDQHHMAQELRATTQALMESRMLNLSSLAPAAPEE